jgi:hypothetical protein
MMTMAMMMMTMTRTMTMMMMMIDDDDDDDHVDEDDRNCCSSPGRLDRSFDLFPWNLGTCPVIMRF